MGNSGYGGDLFADTSAEFDADVADFAGSVVVVVGLRARSEPVRAGVIARRHQFDVDDFTAIVGVAQHERRVQTLPVPEILNCCYFLPNPEPNLRCSMLVI